MNIEKIEILDKEHPEMKIDSKPERFASIGFANIREIYLNSAAIKETKFESAMYLHFAILDGLLYFYADNDDTGLKLYNAGTPPSHIALKTASIKFVELLISKFPKIKIGDKYKFKKTEGKIKEAYLYEVLLDKPIKVRDKFIAPKPSVNGNVFSQPRPNQL